MRKMFFDNLPRKGKLIDWKSSVGYLVSFIYEDIEGEVLIFSYENNVLGIKYLDKDIFYIKTADFRNCAIGRLLEKITSDFKLEIGDVLKSDKRDMVIIDKFHRDISKNQKKKRVFKYYKYKCNICGFAQGEMDEYSLMKGIGCSCCKGLTVAEGINDIPTTAPWMVKYFQGGYDEAKFYTKSSNKKIKPICPDCGKILDNEMKIYSIYRYKSINCICGSGFSYPERLMYNILKTLNIDFAMQYSPEWIKPMRYDFYIPNKDIIIEMDGGLGHGNRVHHRAKKTVQETKEIDTYKDNMALKNGIRVIRIDSIKSELEHIKNNIVNSDLPHIIDLVGFDWLLCEELSRKNMVKEICDYWNESENKPTFEVANHFNISVDTVREYLNIGAKIGWTDYDGQIELKKAVERQFNIKPYKVEVYKDGKLIEDFETYTDLEKRSIDVLGCKIYRRSVKLRLNKESDFYGKDFKGYTFKYIEL